MVNATYDDGGNLIATLADGTVNTYNNGDTGYILISAILVMIMSPGVGYMYSGLLRRKNALSMLFLSLAVYSVATIQWFFWGYSLAFSDTGSKFIGNLKHFGLMNVDLAPSQGSSKIPALLFALYQLQFAAITPCLVIGGCAERARMLPILVATFCWCTLVYDPIACWTWNPTGWGFINGVLDFAGGGPVHMTSGTASLVWSFYLGRRRGYGTTKLAYRPHSVSHVVTGTVLLWFGWFGFNGGSELAMNLRAVQASMVTNIAAAMGGITWMLLDYFRTGKYSAVALCSGIVAGLVGITPAAGFVGSPAALAIGFVTAIAANYATGIKNILRIDDAVDGFALHGIGGLTGAIMTGFFADWRVAGFDGYTEISGGWINHNYRQMGWQLASAVSVISYTAVMTYIILFVVDHIPGLRLRASEDAEILGIDETELGETGYDFVFMNRDLESPEDVHGLSNKTAVGISSSHNSSREKVAHRAKPPVEVQEGEASASSAEQHV